MSEHNTMRGPADATVCSAAPEEQRSGDEPQRSADSLSIEDVSVWYTQRGISHIVAWFDGRWSGTLCDTMWSGPPDDPSSTQRKVCKRCRERLKTAKKAC
jgi:hypothetical protein